MAAPGKIFLILPIITILLAQSLLGSSLADRWRTYIAEEMVLLDGQSDSEAAAQIVRETGMTGQRLVLMGEITHGTHEFYTWRAEITQALIEAGHTRFVAFEGDWLAWQRANDFVQGEISADGFSVGENLTRWPGWMWGNPVIEDFLHWLRSWNAERPESERVGVYGMDVYGWDESIQTLPEAFERLSSELAEEGSAVVEPFLGITGGNDGFYQALSRRSVPTLERWEAFQEKLAAALADPALSADERSDYFNALQKSGEVLRAKQHLTRNFQRHPRSWNPRARHFFETVERLLAYYGEDSGGVAWAHNTHIGDARATPMAQGGLVTIGQLAREGLGEDAVFLLGLTSSEGAFRAGTAWGSPGQVMPLPRPDHGTFDRWLHEQEGDLFLVPLAQARGDARLRLAAGLRAIGVVHAGGRNMGGNYVPSAIPNRFDALLYIRRSAALSESAN